MTLAANQSTPSWSDLLVQATTAHAVVALANEFLARLSASEVSLLPATCTPKPLSSAVAVNSYAIDLKTCRCTNVMQAELVDRMSVFFQAACDRVATITGPQRHYAYSLRDRPETTSKG